MTHGLNSEMFSEKDIREIQDLAETDPTDLAMEIGILRLLIRRAAAVTGIDPVPVLDGVSSAADRLARVLKAQRVLKGEAAESMTLAIAAAVRRFRELRSQAVVGEVDMRPGCAFGVMVQTGLDDVRGDMEDVKAELAWMRKVVVTAIVAAAVATLLRLAGLGV